MQYLKNTLAQVSCDNSDCFHFNLKRLNTKKAPRVGCFKGDQLVVDLAAENSR